MDLIKGNYIKKLCLVFNIYIGGFLIVSILLCFLERDFL